MTNQEILQEIKSIKSSRRKEEKLSVKRQQEIKDRKKRWMTLWRNNPNLYIHYKMGISSFPYQHYSYFTMGDATNYVDVSTRGVSKTFKAIVYAAAMCLQFPHYSVAVMAVSRGQVSADFETTFKKEICNKNSYFMAWLLNNGLITYKETEKGYIAQFWNGSSIIFLPAIDSSRGEHVQMLIVEECRLIKKTMVDSVGVPMLTLRQPQYKKNKTYSNYKSKFDIMKQVYITSNRFKNEWFNTLYNKTFVSYFKDKYSRHRVFNSDIFLAIKYGLKDAKWFYATRKSLGTYDFAMEILNETLGESESSFFTLDMVRKAQNNSKVFYPPLPQELSSRTYHGKPKAEDEIRIIVVDFAFANATTKEKNDNTVMICMSLKLEKNGEYHRYVDYIQTMAGGEQEKALKTIRELFYDYKADYCVMDLLNGGEIHYTNLTREYDHPTRGSSTWDKSGLTVCKKMEYNVLAEAKINDLANRAIDRSARPVIIPMQGHKVLNSAMWNDLFIKLKNDEISLPLDDLDYEQRMSEKKEYLFATSEERARLKYPYVQGMFLLNEMINLSPVYNEGYVKLVEQRQGTKDIAVALSYGNYILTLIQNNKEKGQTKTGFDINEWRLFG